MRNLLNIIFHQIIKKKILYIIKNLKNFLNLCLINFYKKKLLYKAQDFKILLITKKFYEKGMKRVHHNEIFFDEIKKQKNISILYTDTHNYSLINLIKFCKRKKIGKIICAFWDSNTISIEFLKFMKQIGIKIIFFWWDTCTYGFKKAYKKELEISDFNYIVDNPMFINFENKKKENFFCNTFFIPSKFCSKKLIKKKDIDVIFIGQTSSYRAERKQYINHIKKNLNKKFNFEVFSSSSRNRQISHSKFYNLLKRSKISLEFPKSVDYFQLKGRVWESIGCGSVLFCEKNKQIDKIFTPYKEYVPYKDKKDLIEKIEKHLENPKKLKKISVAAQKKFFDIQKKEKRKMFQIFGKKN